MILRAGNRRAAMNIARTKDLEIAYAASRAEPTAHVGNRR
jgi:hypothetical protein